MSDLARRRLESSRHIVTSCAWTMTALLLSSVRLSVTDSTCCSLSAKTFWTAFALDRLDTVSFTSSSTFSLWRSRDSIALILLSILPCKLARTALHYGFKFLHIIIDVECLLKSLIMCILDHRYCSITLLMGSNCTLCELEVRFSVIKYREVQITENVRAPKTA